MVVARRHVPTSTVTALRPVNGATSVLGTSVHGSTGDALSDAFSAAQAEVLRDQFAALWAALKAGAAPKALRLRDVAAMSGCHINTIRAEVRAKRLVVQRPTKGTIRVKPSDYAAWLESGGAR